MTARAEATSTYPGWLVSTETATVGSIEFGVDPAGPWPIVGLDTGDLSSLGRTDPDPDGVRRLSFHWPAGTRGLIEARLEQAAEGPWVLCTLALDGVAQPVAWRFRPLPDGGLERTTVRLDPPPPPPPATPPPGASSFGPPPSAATGQPYAGIPLPPAPVSRPYQGIPLRPTTARPGSPRIPRLIGILFVLFFVLPTAGNIVRLITSVPVLIPDGPPLELPAATSPDPNGESIFTGPSMPDLPAPELVEPLVLSDVTPETDETGYPLLSGGPVSSLTSVPFEIPAGQWYIRWEALPPPGATSCRLVVGFADQDPLAELTPTIGEPPDAGWRSLTHVLSVAFGDPLTKAWTVSSTCERWSLRFQREP